MLHNDRLTSRLVQNEKRVRVVGLVKPRRRTELRRSVSKLKNLLIV